MKQLKPFILCFVYLFSFSSAIFLKHNSINNFNILNQDDTDFIVSTSEKSQHDGVFKGTLILTIDGPVPIEDLKVNHNLGNDNHVVDISIGLVNQCIEIQTEKNTFKVANDQLFYIPDLNEWKAAKDLSLGSLLSDNPSSKIISIRHLDNYAVVYKLTTSHHTFYIENNICIHNADLTFGLLVAGGITMINPVTALLGATIALIYAGKQLYEKRNIHLLQNLGENKEYNIDDLDVFEREYYLGRKRKLMDLRGRYINLKNGLEGLSIIFHKKEFNSTFDFNALLHPNFFRKIYYDIHSIRRTTFDNNQRNSIREKREKELLEIENDIIALQTVIAIHFGQLVEKTEKLMVMCSFYDEKTLKIIKPVYKQDHWNERGVFKFNDTAVSSWNQNQNNIIEPLSLENYKKILFALPLIEKAEAQQFELKATIKYYEIERDAIVIKKTTNIPDLICILEPKIKGYENLLKSKKNIFLQRRPLEENFLSSRGYKLNDIKNNTFMQFQQIMKQYQTEVLRLAKTKHDAIKRDKASLIDKTGDDKNDCPCKKGQKPCLLEACECYIKNGCKKLCRCTCDINCKCKCPAKKSEFFSLPIIKDNYAHCREGVYKLKPRGIEIIKGVHYLKWDYTHSDVEIWSDGVKPKHLGCLDPKTLKLNDKPAVPTRKLFSGR